MSQRYRVTAHLPVDRTTAFAYHERPGALQRLIPPWENVTVERSDGSLTVGSRVVLKQSIFGLPLRWVAEHTDYDPPRLFADTQVSGPFAKWNHRHEFNVRSASDHDNGDQTNSDPNDADRDGECDLIDDIVYRLPGGAAGRLAGGPMARRTIEAMFAYRHRITADDLALAKRYDVPSMTIAVSGASGMVGRSLCSLLTLLGHRVRTIVRHPAENGDQIAIWDSPAEAEKLRDVDAVVHLAGRNIAGDRWTDEVKTQIRESRTLKTTELCERMASLDVRPKTLVCASAIGIYGDRGDTVMRESEPAADDFLGSVAERWESSCDPARDAGVRVVNARFGLILSADDGALAKSLFAAKMFGGRLGSGDQWWSWIALDDVVGSIYHAIMTPNIHGPVNFVAPNPVQNRDFAGQLARVLNRRALLPAPAFVLRSALGEMADALLLASTRVSAEKLVDSGYQFRFGELSELLRYTLGRNRLKSEV